MPLGGLLQGAEAFQSPVHAGGAHAPTHGREAAQMHGEAPVPPHIGAESIGSKVDVCLQCPFLCKQVFKIFLKTALTER